MELSAGVMGGGSSGASSCGDWGWERLAPDPTRSFGVFLDFIFLVSTTAALSSFAAVGAMPRPKPVPSVSPTPASRSEPLCKNIDIKRILI